MIQHPPKKDPWIFGKLKPEALHTTTDLNVSTQPRRLDGDGSGTLQTAELLQGLLKVRGEVGFEDLGFRVWGLRFRV